MSLHTTPWAQEARTHQASVVGKFGDPVESADRRPSCAINGNRSVREPHMSGAPLDPSDHEVGLTGAIGFARSIVGHFGPDEQGFNEVESVNARRVGIPQQEHLARWALRHREHEHLALSYGIASSGRSPSRFRNSCRVSTASPPMGFADYITGRNPGVINRG
jgi:hypothetical protein